MAEYEHERTGNGRRTEDAELHIGPCEKVVILSTEVPLLSSNVLVINTKMTIGISLLMLISGLLLTQSLYQIPVLREQMIAQDTAQQKVSAETDANVKALRNDVDDMRTTVDNLVSAAYVLRTDLAQSRKTEKRNTAAIKKNTDELAKPKSFFGGRK
jgi:hypothetical protein